jgi:hypothetical protein
VVDRDGRPIESIEVRAYPENWAIGRPAWSFARTGAKGEFRITGLRSEPHRLQALETVRFMGPSWKSGPSSEPIPGVRPGAKGLRLVLLPPGAVVGTVAGATAGGTLAGLAVYICPAGREYQGSPFGNLGGTVAVPCRVEGRRLVPIEPREGVRESRVVKWEKGDDLTKETVGALDEVPCAYRVLDDRVEFGEGGRFRAEGLRQGRWRLEVDDIRALPGSVEFEVKPGRESKVEIPVRPRGWLDVQVTGSDVGPLPGASVVVLDAKGDAVPVLVETVVLSQFGGMHSASTLSDLFHELTTTGREGGTERRYLDPGSYGVRVLAEGYRSFSATLEVTDGKPSSLEVRLEPER